MKEFKRRLLNFLICADQMLFNILTLGRSSPDETISAAAWRLEQAGKWQGRIFRPLIDAIFLPFEDNHCYRSFEAERRLSHLPDAYRS